MINNSIEERQNCYVHSDVNSHTVFFEKAIALMPVVIWAGFHFGIRSVYLTIISTVFSLAVGSIIKTSINTIKAKRFVSGISLLYAFQGLLIALAMPHNVRLWVILSADLIAVIPTSLLTIGAGAITICPVTVSISAISLITKEFSMSSALVSERLKYPIDIIFEGETPDITIPDLLLGNVDGKIGEISAALLAAGFIYLIIRKHISWYPSIAAVAVIGILAYEFAPENTAYYPYVINMICSGGLVFGAFYILSDPSVLPSSGFGKIITGLIVGGGTYAFRHWLNVDGVYYSITIATLLSPVIDSLTEPSVFGMVSKKKTSDNKKTKTEDRN